MSNLRASFYEANNSIWVRIKIIGDPNEVDRKVKDEDKIRFKREWAAFEAGRVEPEPEGTPLTDIPGVSEAQAKVYKARGVRTAEELVALDDIALKGLGMGALTNRKAAQTLLSGEPDGPVATVTPIRRRKMA